MSKSRFESTVGPASEVDPEVWCIDCGHYVGVHKSDKCEYWTGLCKCVGFISRSEALQAVRAGDMRMQGEKGGK